MTQVLPPMFDARVVGDPATQGSHTAIIHQGKPIVIADNKKLRPWRRTMEGAFRKELSVKRARMPMFESAVAVSLVVILPRLAKHGKKDDPGPADTGLDLDKLQRAVGDSLTDAGVIVDDKRICDWHATKRWSRLGEDPGIEVMVWPL